MDQKPYRSLAHCLCLCFMVREYVLVQASQEAPNPIDQSSSYFIYQQPEYPRDCKEIQQQCSAQNSSRVHLIKPDGLLEPFQAYCDNEWTIIQRRVEHFVDFNRDWIDYRDGFGFLNADFWIGNEELAHLTNQKQYELMINVEMETGESGHVIYNKFRTSDEFNGYKLISVGDFTGNLGSLLTRSPSDGYDLQQAGNTPSGDYIVDPVGWSGEPFTINCNMDIDGGGWTVFQRRIDGTKSFNLGWNSYKEGFGSTSGEFWMGNDKLAFLTNQKNYELRIDLVNKDEGDDYSYQEGGDSYFAKYDLFRITDESNKYRLVGLGNSTGTVGFDALRYHHYMAFSTTDRDNDVDVDYNIASVYQSAWWYIYYYYYCDLSSPFTGGYYAPYWYYLPGNDYIEYTEMKIRPVKKF